MSTKLAPQGIVAQSFSHNNLLAARQNDIVEVVPGSNFEVQTALGAGRPIGRIITIDLHTDLVVVELFSAQILDCVAGSAAVSGGAHVKLENVGNTTGTDPYVAPPTANNIPISNAVTPGEAGDGFSFGIALNSAVATVAPAAPQTVTVVVL